MITLPNITEIKTTTPTWELPWNHPNKLMTIRVFRGRWDAREYIRYQGLTTRQAVVRMCKMPGHEWANEHGNVAIVRFGEKEPVGGWLYLFANGGRLGLWAHGLPED